MIELTREEAEELYQYMFDDLSNQYNSWYNNYIMPKGQTLEKWCKTWSSAQYNTMLNLRRKLDA